MAPPYDAILRRNLQELESDLTRILQSPPPPPPVTDAEEAAVDGAGGAAPTAAAAAASLHDDIVRRFEFLKNLSTLEEESLPGDKRPEHLDDTKNRLASLEDAYHRWLFFGTSPPSPLAQTPLDGAPPCACTSSCFDDDGDGDEWMELSYDETPPAEEEHVEPAAVPLCVEPFSRSTEDTRSWAAAHGRRKVCALSGGVKLLLAAAAAAAGLSLVLTSMWAVKDEQRPLLLPT